MNFKNQSKKIFLWKLKNKLRVGCENQPHVKYQGMNCTVLGKLVLCQATQDVWLPYYWKMLPVGACSSVEVEKQNLDYLSRNIYLHLSPLSQKKLRIAKVRAAQ